MMLAENTEQNKAIKHFTGPCMVIAPPGSGKTFTMIKRIRYLIEEKGVSADEILVVTFTKAAAEEMKKRFLSECRGNYYTTTFGTFHAIYFYILKEQYSYTFQNIVTQNEKREILKTAFLTINSDREYDENTIEELLCELEKINREELLDSELKEIYKAYEKEKVKRNKLDFEDMTFLCYKLFQEKSDVLRYWQKRYRYILIDEFQDINEMQFEVIKMLAGKEQNLFVVGDDDQAIYGFRGAKPDIMLRLPKVFPTIEKIVLSINYRSTKVIVEASKKVIEKNKNRFSKNSKAYKENSKEITYCEVENTDAEKAEMISIIRKKNWNEVAVIFRTNKSAATFAETLTKEKIPFCLKVNAKSFYQHFIVRDIFAYLKFAIEERKRSYFLMIMNKPLRYISRSALPDIYVDFEKLKSFYRTKEVMKRKVKELERAFELLQELPLYAGIHYIRKGLGYESYLKNYALECGCDFKEYEKVLDDLQERARGQRSFKEWLYEISVYEKELGEQLKRQRDNMEEGVKLLTMHASKGLEFQSVLIPEITEGNIPYKKAQTEELVEEERRLFYVAITRAKEELFFIYAKKNQDISKEISRFILDMEIIPRLQ